MKKLFICKVCGYIAEKNDPPGVCPACGFKGKIFEEYESPISKKRRKILDLHIHPVMVHLPIAFVVGLVLISLLRMIGVIHDQSELAGMLRVIVVVLPFVAISAAMAGIFDAKLRFKRIDTPHLKIKLVLAFFLILISISLFVIQFLLNLNHSTYKIVVLIHSVVLFGFALMLGLIGGRLRDSKVRG